MVLCLETCNTLLPLNCMRQSKAGILLTTCKAAAAWAGTTMLPQQWTRSFQLSSISSHSINHSCNGTLHNGFHSVASSWASGRRVNPCKARQNLHWYPTWDKNHVAKSPASNNEQLGVYAKRNTLSLPAWQAISISQIMNMVTNNKDRFPQPNFDSNCAQFMPGGQPIPGDAAAGLPSEPPCDGKQSPGQCNGDGSKVVGINWMNQKSLYPIIHSSHPLRCSSR